MTNTWIPWKSNATGNNYATIIIYKCSNCGHATSVLSNYCPNCGEKKNNEV